MKYYVVSDIHGYYDILINSLKKEGFFNDTKPHKLIVCGDLFDRGKEAKKIEKFIYDLIKKDQVILIKGNHEHLIYNFINNIESYLPNIAESYEFRNSTVDTVCQLCKCSEKYLYKNKEKIKEKMLKTKLFKYILPYCIDYYETKNYIFTHGYIPMNSDDEDKKFKEIPNWRNATEVMWYRARWYNGMEADKYRTIRDKTIVVGHWHCSYGHHYFENDGDEFGDNANYNPFIKDKFMCIDGCVPRSKKINCVVIEDEDFINIYKKNKEGLEIAINVLKEDKIILLPTETVFGVATAFNNYDKLVELKNRPLNKAFPVCVGSKEMIYELCSLSSYQEKAVKKLLPGPITLILPLKNKLVGMETVAIRFSDDKFINDIINSVNKPLFLTSANISGKEPFKNAYRASLVFKDKIGCYINGKVNYNKASTIVDLTSDSIKILRQGPLSYRQIIKLMEAK